MRTFVLITLLIFSITANAYSISEQATADYFTRIENNPEKLQIFLKTMPKGGDLHNHLSGAALAENMIRYVQNDPICIDQQTLTVQEKADCSPAYLIKNIANMPSIYNATIDAWSMRNFQSGKESSHDHFFAAFGKYAVISHKLSNQIVQEVAQKACKQNLLYLELMVTLDKEASKQLGKHVGWNPNLSQLTEKLLQQGLHGIVKKNV